MTSPSDLSTQKTARSESLKLIIPKFNIIDCISFYFIFCCPFLEIFDQYAGPFKTQDSRVKK